MKGISINGMLKKIVGFGIELLLCGRLCKRSRRSKRKNGSWSANKAVISDCME